MEPDPSRLASRLARDAARVLDLAMSRPPTLGAGRVLAVDGPAGSGKTTLVAAIAAAAPPSLGVRVVHLDDLYAGWDGLPHVGEGLAALLRPMAEGRAGTYRQYDWEAGRLAEAVTVSPAELLVLDGVGSGHREVADLVTVLVWCGTDWATGFERALARDVAAHPSAAADLAAYASALGAWQEAEAAHFAVDATWERADITLG